MTGALAYEWRRIISVRSTYWLTALTIVLSGTIAFFIALSFTSNDFTSDGIANYLQASTMVVTAAGSIVFVPVISAPFCGVIGAMAFGHEYRYGTIKQTLTAVPNRFSVFFAKLIVLLGWLLGVMAIVLLVNTLMGALFLGSFHLSGESVRPIVFFVVYNLGWGISGFALAAVFRNLAGALVAVLVYPLVVETIGYNVLRFIQRGSLNELTNLFPAAAGRRTLFLPYDLFADPTGGEVTVHVWGPGASAAVFIGGLTLLTGFALALFLKRDA